MSLCIFCALPKFNGQFVRTLSAVRVALYSIASGKHIEAHPSRCRMLALLGAVAVLFNPILPIHFSRDAWQVVDGLAAAVFLVTGLRIK